MVVYGLMQPYGLIRSKMKQYLISHFSYRAEKSLPVRSDHGMKQGNWQMYFLGGTNIYFMNH